MYVGMGVGVLGVSVGVGYGVYVGMGVGVIGMSVGVGESRMALETSPC